MRTLHRSILLRRGGSWLPAGNHAWLLRSAGGQIVSDVIGSQDGHLGADTNPGADDPTYATDANGKEYANFDGGDFVTLPQEAYDLATQGGDFVLFFVLAPDDGQPASVEGLLNYHNGSSHELLVRLTGAGKIHFEIAGGPATSVTSVFSNGAYATPVVLALHHMDGDNQSHFYLNTLTRETIAHSVAPVDLTGDAFLGAGNSSGTPNTQFNGKIWMHSVGYGMSDADIQAEITSLANEYGITLS